MEEPPSLVRHAMMRSDRRPTIGDLEDGFLSPLQGCVVGNALQVPDRLPDLIEYTASPHAAARGPWDFDLVFWGGPQCGDGHGEIALP